LIANTKHIYQDWKTFIIPAIPLFEVDFKLDTWPDIPNVSGSIAIENKRTSAEFLKTQLSAGQPGPVSPLPLLANVVGNHRKLSLGEENATQKKKIKSHHAEVKPGTLQRPLLYLP
jgi:hypothetical protein